MGAPMRDAAHTSIAVPAIADGTVSIAARWPAIVLLALGFLVLYGVGFTTASATHNATHDTRHANGFPCH